MLQNACYVSAIFITFNLFYMISAREEISPSITRTGRRLFPLLGYIQGYKIGQNLALQLPPFILSPIVIVPTVNQQQSVNIQKASGEESYQENGGTIQKIVPAKLIQNSTEDENIESKQQDSSLSLKTFDSSEMSSKNDNLSYTENDTFKQIPSGSVNVSDSQENTEGEDYFSTTPYSTTASDMEDVVTNNTTKASGPYPTAVYNNSNISTLSITISPLENNLTVPKMEDKWQNFSMPSLGESKNVTKETNTNDTNSMENNIIFFPTTSPSIGKYSFYPPPRYTQNVDKLSITTNSYINEDSYLMSAYNDRWERFPPERKSHVNSGFRPLAGLYYDGFLHKSLDKQMGFLPNGNINYYY